MKGIEMAEKLNVLAVMQREADAAWAHRMALDFNDASGRGLLYMEATEARAAVIELAAAVRERMALSSGSKQPTGPFAESDARIDAALSPFETSP